MLFNSVQFAIFLPIVFVIYWLFPPKKRWIVLLVSSYYFYMSWNIKYVVLILLITVLSYLMAISIEKDRNNKRKYLMITVIISLGILFIFKYFNFLMNSLFNVINLFSNRDFNLFIDVMLPVGISFYTFQAISYVVDVYRGDVQAESNIGKYATFISFFPQLVAGPIERTKNLMKQIKEEHFFEYDKAAYGLRIMLWGFFKKMVIADTFAIYVDKIYNDIYMYKGFSLILATFFFAIQIYCDFSGYSDIAIGTAKLFGIDLIKNFNSPYFSTSIKEFWSRWHISLSTWFKDYVYIPLGGNRVSKLRHKINLVITFLVSGLWHGANWNFVIWGGIHGVAQAIESCFNRKKRFVIVKGISVFIFVLITWVFFRAQTLSEALHVFAYFLDGITEPYNYLKTAYQELGFSVPRVICGIIQLLILFTFDLMSKDKDIIACLGQQRTIFRWIVYLLITLLLIAWTPIKSSSEFIYFQF